MSDTPATDNASQSAAGSAPHTIEMVDYADEWSGQSVTIRPHLSYAASARIEGAKSAMKAQLRPDRRKDDDIEMLSEVTPIDFAAAVVEECVNSWTLRGYDGEVLEPNRAGISSPQAPAVLVDVVVDAIMEFYEARAPKLKERSKPSG